jgi:hypothetical protein
MSTLIVPEPGPKKSASYGFATVKLLALFAVALEKWITFNRLGLNA